MKVLRVIEKFIRAVSILDGFIVVALMLMINADIILRALGKSITGGVEIATIVVPVIVFLGVGYTALKEMHIRVDIFKGWPYMDRVTNFLCIVTLAVIGYFCLVQGFQVKSLGTASTVLRIPRWPVVMVTAFGMFMVTLAMILNEIKAYSRLITSRKNRGPELSRESDAE